MGNLFLRQKDSDMAKHSLPRIDGTAPQQQTRQEQPAASVVQSVPASEGYNRTLIYASTLSIKRLSKSHRNAFCTIIRRLQDSGARLQDGSAVTDKTKAFLWMIENADR
jgi:hypothetical protein